MQIVYHIHLYFLESWNQEGKLSNARDVIAIGMLVLTSCSGSDAFYLNIPSYCKEKVPPPPVCHMLHIMWPNIEHVAELALYIVCLPKCWTFVFEQYEDKVVSRQFSKGGRGE